MNTAGSEDELLRLVDPWRGRRRRGGEGEEKGEDGDRGRMRRIEGKRLGLGLLRRHLLLLMATAEVSNFNGLVSFRVPVFAVSI